MEYSNNDFEGLFLNVWGVRGDLFKAFPILTKYKEFQKSLKKFNLPTDKVIRYIVYAFDKNSPLSGILDIMERRYEALELAKFPKDKNGNYSKKIELMVHSGIPDINRMVIRYCLFTGDTEYAVLTTYEDALIKELNNLMIVDKPMGKTIENETDPTDKKSVIISNIAKLKKLIKELKDEIFSNNVDAFLLRSLTEFTEAERLELSPEYFAKQLKDWDNISRYYKS